MMVNVDLMDLIHHNTCLSTLDWFSSEWQVSHPVLRPRPDAHRMYARDQVVIHTARM
jgi:hypothetical protein